MYQIKDLSFIRNLVKAIVEMGRDGDAFVKICAQISNERW